MKHLLIAVLLLIFALPASAQSRPNILWISAEDISPDLGSYGDGYAHTPNLDKLASQGVRFAKAFSVAPVCAPSRSAIITGMYATSIGSHHMRSKAVPPVGVKAFPEYLRAAGYYCTNNSKTDYNFEAPPSNAPPVTVWDESESHRPLAEPRAGSAVFCGFQLDCDAREPDPHRPARVCQKHCRLETRRPPRPCPGRASALLPRHVNRSQRLGPLL